MIPVIICGGFGTKLWPLSRQFKPKQLISLVGEKSLFQINYEALRKGFSSQEIYVSTNKDQKDLIKKQAPDIPDSNYIIEPQMRNQGPATGLIAAALLKAGKGDEPFMIIQVDDIREPVEGLIKMLKDCDELAKKDSRYITGGLKPKKALMGVDHLVKGKRVSSEDETGIYEVDEFIWRSDKKQTEKLLERGDVLIHTNHTCMSPINFLEMLRRYRKDWYEPLMNIVDGKSVGEEYAKMPEGPLEDVTQKVHKDGKSLVVELPFEWWDIGTYDSLHEYLKLKGLYKTSENVVDLNGRDNFVKLDDPNKVVALVGVDNLVVIDTGDALLVCSKDATGTVNEALKEVKKRNLGLT